MHSAQSDPKASVGVLLVNLGTPDSTSIRDVRNYLREFLSDPRVLDLPAPLRWLLLHAIILRFRPRRSAEAYKQIWQPEGSPLLIHGHALREAVATELTEDFRVELAMRYGRPSLESAIQNFAEAGVQRIVVVPLFPQYSEAATGSALARALKVIEAHESAFSVEVIRDFHTDSAFIDTQAALTQKVLSDFDADHLLFSYHGLPESQLRSTGPCLDGPRCCENPERILNGCYRAQCFATSRALATSLGLAKDFHTTAFQSRLAGGRWIRPYTDRVVVDLATRGLRRLGVVCPAFTADNLETLEEIGIRLRQQWRDLGGEELALVPCVNSESSWALGVAKMARRAAAR